MIVDKVAFETAALWNWPCGRYFAAATRRESGVDGSTEAGLHAAADTVGGGDLLTVVCDVTKSEEYERAVAQSVQRLDGRPLCGTSIQRPTVSSGSQPQLRLAVAHQGA